MKITADRYIPFLKGVFEPYAEVVYKDGREIGPDDVRDSDALIVRTRTRCGRELLQGSRVGIVASATIGTDHIDTGWCAANGIEVANAAGCNAGGVLQYVFTALYTVASSRSINLKGKTLGIIGVGNVGSLIDTMASELGFRTLRCDPPRAEREGPEGFCTLEELLRGSDIVTMHTWLDTATRGMADSSFFSLMREGAVFINASRGEVVSDDALKQARGHLGAIILDTWNNEPDIDRELLSMTDIATPHIAGYTFKGKMNGSSAAVRAVARHFGIEELYGYYPEGDPDKESVDLNFDGLGQEEIRTLLSGVYDIMEDDRALRERTGEFESLRSGYDYRKEFNHMSHN